MILSTLRHFHLITDRTNWSSEGRPCETHTCEISHYVRCTRLVLCHPSFVCIYLCKQRNLCNYYPSIRVQYLHKWAPNSTTHINWTSPICVHVIQLRSPVNTYRAHILETNGLKSLGSGKYENSKLLFFLLKFAWALLTITRPDIFIFGQYSASNTQTIIFLSDKEQWQKNLEGIKTANTPSFVEKVSPLQNLIKTE